MSYIRRVFQSGNSRAVTLPAYLCEYLNLVIGDHVVFFVGDDGMVFLFRYDDQIDSHFKKDGLSDLPVVHHDE